MNVVLGLLLTLPPSPSPPSPPTPRSAAAEKLEAEKRRAGPINAALALGLKVTDIVKDGPLQKRGSHRHN